MGTISDENLNAPLVETKDLETLKYYNLAKEFKDELIETGNVNMEKLKEIRLKSCSDKMHLKGDYVVLSLINEALSVDDIVIEILQMFLRMVTEKQGEKIEFDSCKDITILTAKIKAALNGNSVSYHHPILTRTKKGTRPKGLSKYYNKVNELYSNGMKKIDIARELKINPSTVTRIIQSNALIDKN